MVSVSVKKIRQRLQSSRRVSARSATSTSTASRCSATSAVCTIFVEQLNVRHHLQLFLLLLLQPLAQF